jgi:large subunit ribosomal protein L28
MSKRCFVTGRGTAVGNLVSHSNRKNKRKFIPNLHTISLQSEILGRGVALRISTRGIRTIEHNMGIDSYLLKTPSSKLPSDMRVLKRKMKKLQLLAQKGESDKKVKDTTPSVKEEKLSDDESSILKNANEKGVAAKKDSENSSKKKETKKKKSTKSSKKKEDI